MKDRYGNKHIDILQDWEVEPGCRDFSLRVRTVRNKTVRIDLSIEAALVVANEILRMHDAAWEKGIPIDCWSEFNFDPLGGIIGAEC